MNQVMPIAERFSTLMHIKDFIYTDSKRPSKHRFLGGALACRSLQNLWKNITGADRVRTGYSAAYGQITNGGSGYTSAPTVTVSGGGSPSVTAVIEAVVSNGKVRHLNVTTRGVGYTSVPTISFSSGSAAATAVLFEGGVADFLPLNFEILKVGSIQDPEQSDVQFGFCAVDGSEESHVKMNPHWIGTTRNDRWVKLNETKLSVDPTNVDVTIGATTTITIANASTYFTTLEQTTNYFKGWVVAKFAGEWALITASSVTTNIMTITTLQDVGSSGFGWNSATVFSFYRFFHDNLGYAPTYNNDLANPIAFNTEHSVIRFSGGQSSTSTRNGIIVFPHIKRTYFPSLARTFTYEGTYVSERRCSSLTSGTSGITLGAGQIYNATVTTGLSIDKTYWIAIAAIYDGYQIGELTKLESASYYTTTPTNWTDNYLKSTAATTEALVFAFAIDAARLNKRVTGFKLYMAQDMGDTRATGRVTPYYAVATFDLTSSTYQMGGYTKSALAYVGSTTQKYGADFGIDGNNWNSALAEGNTYQSDSGIIETPADTMYSHSIEETVGGRRWISNVYVTSEGQIDRQSVFTNPIGGDANLNAGVIQPDIFSNEDGIYRLDPKKTIGTKVTAIIPLDLEEMLVVKDRGVVFSRIVSVDNIPNLINTVYSSDAGGASINAWCRDDNGWAYFAGYDDVWRYRGGVLQQLVDRADMLDWLDDYRNISTTEKENTTIVYLPEHKAVVLLLGNNRSTATGYNLYQYAYFPPEERAGEYNVLDGRWRPIRFKESSNLATASFKYFTRLQNGHVLGVTTDSTPVVKRLSWKYNSGEGKYLFYYSDDGTAIAPDIDTGEFVIDQSKDFEIDSWKIIKSTDQNTQGTLVCESYLDGTLIHSISGLDKTQNYLTINFLSDETRIGTTLRLKYNASTTDKERLNAGDMMQIDGLLVYGGLTERLDRFSEIAASSSSDTVCEMTGTINGVHEFTITAANTWETKTFDTATTETYSDADGATVPSWIINPLTVVDRPNGADWGIAGLEFRNRTLGGFDVRYPEGNVKVVYSFHAR